MMVENLADNLIFHVVDGDIEVGCLCDNSKVFFLHMEGDLCVEYLLALFVMFRDLANIEAGDLTLFIFVEHALELSRVLHGRAVAELAVLRRRVRARLTL
mgnify:CR=1 FL=1